MVTSDPPVEFGVDVRREGAETRLTVSGELDISTAPLLADELARSLAGSEVTVVVDLRPVSFIDSAGVRALLRYAVDVAPAAKLELIPGTGPVDRVFGLLGAYDRFRLRRASSARARG